MIKSLDLFFDKPSKWQEEYLFMRKILHECGMQEELKWGKPCYTFKGNNIVLIHGFKEYCALLFHKGALLQDSEGILVQQTEHVQAARQLRFTSLEEIKKWKPSIKHYVMEAIEVEKAGLEVPMKKTSEFEMVSEFKERLEGDASLKSAFENLTPGRQRGYLLYFSQAKQSNTRQARVEKYLLKILEGKGLND
ncbi:YdeI/OmpD-associated family protein [Algoriphagus halophilus]|uniref:Uncharacterized conserved protein YdeI, YjbR/CyaY-like superfamily, DUF1801 family n=1 Tax=Algoriphagus halophilus TaxID=226505 RepID=A0A1N6DFK3_9BACT|nr:DUF1801 domain-containing protein [Algoriphagus halophilus]SIN69536.1 Uncharacterized conserved protein YdeI, YjbR/CyaY-like superfamily, DUF1801 family [Algoriphagus halophilus]